MQKALDEFDVPFESDLVFKDVSDIEDGKKLFHSIKQLKEKPDGIFTGSDEIASGIISEAINYGWDIPGDLAVLGYDNQVISTLIRPQITTINQPAADMGKLATEIIIEKMSDESKEPLQRHIHELPLSLILRGSTIK